MTLNTPLQKFPADGSPESAVTRVVSFRFPLQLKNLVAKIARDRGTSATAYVEDAIVTKLAKEGHIHQPK